MSLGFRQWLYVLLLVLTALPAYAAEPAKKDEATAAGSSAELQRLVDTLEDDSRRKAFVGDLKALIALQKKAETDDRSSVGTRLLEALSGKIDSVGTQLGRAAETILDLPRLAGWLQQGMANPQKRAEWLLMIAKLSAILAAGLIAQSFVQWLLRRPLATIEAQRTESRAMRILLAILRTLLEFVGIAACLAAAYGAMTLVDPTHQARVVALAVINALIVTRIILATAKFTFAPHIADMRLIPVSDETANYAFLWIRRLTYLTVYGFFAIEALPALGVSRSAHDMLMKLLGLLVCLLLVILVLQNRQAVAGEIRGEAGPVFGQFRRRLADVWHLLAIMYLVTIFGVWSLEVPGGFEFILRATLLSLVILLIAQGIVMIATRVIQRGFSLSTEQKLRFPGLEARANRYLPVLVIVTQVFIYGLAALAFLQTWGLNVVDWLSSPLGAAIVSRIVRIFMILAVALIMWEFISALIERYLSATDDRGNVIQRGQRAQTLLPLLRNVVLIVIAVMATLTVLAELGVDTGPLIAGAGILGLAVGFGAQTFVKDVITGFFILVEDAVAVGDLVEVGGHSGKVEAMTIRSIQLRDLRGEVHRVPFSEVTSTINRSKGFSFAVFSIGVAYREDVDRCMNVIREIGDEMRADPAFSTEILDSIEIMGVESLADSAVQIGARIKVRPGRQYMLQRAFNRLLKRRFDAEGIEIPFPHRTIYFGVDSQGHAPPLHVQMQEARHARPPAEKAESEPLTKEPEGEQRNFKEVVSPQADSAPKKE